MSAVATLLPEPAPRRHLEDDLQAQVADYLAVALPPGAVVHHSPGEGLRSKAAQGRLVRSGFCKGWPDFEIVWRGRVLFHRIEGGARGFVPSAARMPSPAVVRRGAGHVVQIPRTGRGAAPRGVRPVTRVGGGAEGRAPAPHGRPALPMLRQAVPPQARHNAVLLPARAWIATRSTPIWSSRQPHPATYAYRGQLSAELQREVAAARAEAATSPLYRPGTVL